MDLTQISKSWSREMQVHNTSILYITNLQATKFVKNQAAHY